MGYRVALSSVMTTLALIFSYVEALIPFNFGIPGIKLGLSNLVILIALYRLGAGYAFTINMIRILLSGLLFGGVSAMLYSLAGGLLSFAVMFLLIKTKLFSPVGVSMAGGEGTIFGAVIGALVVAVLRNGLNLNGINSFWQQVILGVLVLVASIKFLPFASRSGVNSMMQIAPEIEEAAVIFGVPWRTRMTRILFPIQKSSIISGYLLPVISVMREVALFTLLVPYARYLLTTMLFSFNETGYAQYGSAVTLLIILIIILINFVTNKLTGASFDKGIGG